MCVLAFCGRARGTEQPRASRGITRATLSDTGQEGETQPRLAVTAGVDYNLNLSPTVDIRLGAAYVQEGGGEEYADGSDAEISLDYLRFAPVIRIGTPGEFSVGVIAGPWITYLANCDLGGTLFDGLRVTAACDEAPELEFNSTTTGVMAGVSFELRNRIGLDLMYSSAFSNVATLAGTDAKTRTLIAQVGLVLPF